MNFTFLDYAMKGLALSEFVVVLCKKEIVFCLLCYFLFSLMVFCGTESGDDGVSPTGLCDVTNFCPVTTCHVCFSILSDPLYSEE